MSDALEDFGTRTAKRSSQRTGHLAFTADTFKRLISGLGIIFHSTLMVLRHTDLSLQWRHLSIYTQTLPPFITLQLIVVIETFERAMECECAAFQSS